MTLNLKSKQGLKEFQQKLKLGMVKILNPIDKARQNPNSLRLAINAYCFDCCCYQKSEVKHCTAANCSFHHLRPWQSKKT